MRRLGYKVLVLRSYILLLNHTHCCSRTHELEHLRAHYVRLRGQNHVVDKTPAGNTLRSIEVSEGYGNTFAPNQRIP